MAKPGSTSKKNGKNGSNGLKDAGAPSSAVVSAKVPAEMPARQTAVQIEAAPAVKKENGIIRFIRSHLSIYTMAIMAIMAVMLYIRIALPYSTVFTGWPGNYVNIAADDAPEQMRLVYNTIAHFPLREMYDPFTHYPYGSMVHFGPLFTLINATAALIVGLGHPSDQLVVTVDAYIPPIMGALCAIPTYYIGKKLFGRNAGLLAAVILMFLPGAFLQRSVLGFNDHHIAETLFSVATIAILVYAIDAANKAGLSLERIKNKDIDAIKAPLLYAALAGVAYGAYLLIWPGALLVGFMLFVYFTIQCVFDHIRGKSLDSTLIIALFVYLIPAIMVLPYSLTYPHFDLVYYSFTQPAIMALALVGIGVIYATSRLMEKNKVSRLSYPIVLAGIAIIGVLILYIALPQIYGLVMAGLGKFNASGGMLTVAEARPTYINPYTGQFSLDNFWYAFNWNFYIAILALLVLAYRVYKDDRPGELMFLAWSAIMLWATFTENRFTYYFAVNAALLTAYFAREVFDLFGAQKYGESFRKKVISLDSLSKFLKKNIGQTLAMSLIAIVFLAIAVWPVTVLGENITLQEATGGPGGMEYEWYDALLWMGSHTPDPQGSPVQSSFDYASGQYSIPANYGSERYDYPASAYGVMSWWDYGNVIEYVAHRLPNANPFQAGIIEQNNTTGASPFFCSTDENQSVRMLDALGSRYVVIDNMMATGKFGAIQQWIDDTSGWEAPGNSTYLYSDGVNFYSGSTTVPILQDTDKWNRSIMNRLYYLDADGMDHYRLVYESAGPYYVNMKIVNRQQGYAGYNNPIAFDNLTKATDTYDMYSQYTLASDSSGIAYGYDARPPVKFVKVYEKVAGATLTGSAPDGSSVTASLNLTTDWGRTFTYAQTVTARNGTYSITVPYPTGKMQGAGYSYGILPQGKYTVSYGNTTRSTDVSENAVMTGGTIPVQ